LRASCPRAGACDTRRSIVNHFTAWSRAARRTRSLCTEPTRAETILPQESHSARRASPHHFVRDVRARPNDLAFSCERTNVNSDHKMMVGAFVCCNGLLGRPLIRIMLGAQTQAPRSGVSSMVDCHTRVASHLTNQSRSRCPAYARQLLSHRRVRRIAFNREAPYGVVAGGPAHSILAH
jgi:hypothetical protein